MMLCERLRGKKRRGKKILAPYLCAGYPTVEATLPILGAAAEAGADCIELGVPFSDPLADGPMIQRASAVALRNGMTLSRALDIAASFTATSGTPILLMSYLNPILKMGADKFAQLAGEAGVSACIIPDLPAEETGLVAGAPPLVCFAAPNTSDERLRRVAALDPPFLYCVSVMGVTGARKSVEQYTLAFLRRVKAAISVPSLAGFGVSSAEQAVSLAKISDGVIVGSALVKVLEESRDPHELAGAAAEFIKPFREALDAVSESMMGEGACDAIGD